MSRLLAFLTRAQQRRDDADGRSAAILPEGTLRRYFALDVDALVAGVLAGESSIGEDDRAVTAARLKHAALRAIDREMALIRQARTPSS